MAVPEGYELLGLLGFADKGTYAAGTTYNTGDTVYYNGSTYKAVKNNLKDVTPVDGTNWNYMARGFAAELLSEVMAKDTSGLAGTAGANVTAQALMDAIADKVATKLLLKSDVVSQIVNDATKAASMAALYAVNEKVTQLNSDLKFIDDSIEHAETAYSLFKNSVSFWGKFTHLAYHFRIGGNADTTLGNGHFSAHIMRDEAGAVYTALIINKWTGDAWTMIFTTFDDTCLIKKLS